MDYASSEVEQSHVSGRAHRTTRTRDLASDGSGLGRGPPSQVVTEHARRSTATVVLELRDGSPAGTRCGPSASVSRFRTPCDMAEASRCYLPQRVTCPYNPGRLVSGDVSHYCSSIVPHACAASEEDRTTGWTKPEFSLGWQPISQYATPRGNLRASHSYARTRTHSRRAQADLLYCVAHRPPEPVNCD